jgi:hypothetical protein
MHGDHAYDDDAPSYSHEEFLRVETMRSGIYMYSYRQFDQYLSASLVYLREIQRLCRRDNVRLLVVLIPDEAQVNPRLQSRIMHASGNFDARNWDFARPNRELSKGLASGGIDYLDLTDYFVGASRQQRLYKPNNTHWNIAGNALAAARIRDYLKKIANLKDR